MTGFGPSDAMNDEQDKQSGEAESRIDREIRQARKFTPEEALARMAGPGAMKGASPVSPVQQAETEIGTWLRVHVADPAGVLQMLLQRNLRDSELLLENLEHPLTALTRYCRKVLGSGYLLEELVRQADMTNYFAFELFLELALAGAAFSVDAVFAAALGAAAFFAFALGAFAASALSGAGFSVGVPVTASA